MNRWLINISIKWNEKNRRYNSVGYPEEVQHHTCFWPKGFIGERWATRPARVSLIKRVRTACGPWFEPFGHIMGHMDERQTHLRDNEKSMNGCTKNPEDEGAMNNQKNFEDLASAMYDHRFVTLRLTDGRSVKGRISHISDISLSIGLNPRNRNRFRIDLVEAVEIH